MLICWYSDTDNVTRYTLLYILQQSLHRASISRQTFVKWHLVFIIIIKALKLNDWFIHEKLYYHKTVDKHDEFPDQKTLDKVWSLNKQYQVANDLYILLFIFYTTSLI